MATSTHYSNTTNPIHLDCAFQPNPFALRGWRIDEGGSIGVKRVDTSAESRISETLRLFAGRPSSPIRPEHKQKPQTAATAVCDTSYPLNPKKSRCRGMVVFYSLAIAHIANIAMYAPPALRDIADTPRRVSASAARQLQERPHPAAGASTLSRRARVRNCIGVAFFGTDKSVPFPRAGRRRTPDLKTGGPRCRLAYTFSRASSRSRMMSCQSSSPMDSRMPSGCIPKAHFRSSGSAEWVMENGCSTRVLICPRLTARVME